MDDSALVGVAQGSSDLTSDLQRIVAGQLLLSGKAITQRLALNQRHDVVEGAGSLAGIVEWQDVGMLQIRRQLDLAEEPIGPEGSGQFRSQDLDRDRAAMLQVSGEIDGRHAA